MTTVIMLICITYLRQNFLTSVETEYSLLVLLSKCGGEIPHGTKTNTILWPLPWNLDFLVLL